jgi:rieske iron-sulfur protein
VAQTPSPQTDTGATQAPPDEPLDSDAELESRRHFLLWLIRSSYGAFALAFALPALALRTLTRVTQAVAAGDTLVYASTDRAGVTIHATDLKQGTPVQAFPANKTNDTDNLIELVQLSDDSASIVAYSAICTHLGCTVLARLTDQGYIPCPCHGSQYDPANHAAVVHGPANRALPSLPIRVESDGTITATGGFSGKVGPN